MTQFDRVINLAGETYLWKRDKFGRLVRRSKMKPDPYVEIHITDGVAEVMWKTKGVTVVLLDFDSRDVNGDPHENYYPTTCTVSSPNAIHPE